MSNARLQSMHPMRGAMIIQQVIARQVCPPSIHAPCAVQQVKFGPLHLRPGPVDIPGYTECFSHWTSGSSTVIGYDYFYTIRILEYDCTSQTRLL